MASVRPDCVLVSCEEFTLKSRPVRRILDATLKNHIQTLLRRNGFSRFKVRLEAGRFVVDDVEDADRAAEVISTVSGVGFASPAVRSTFGLDDLAETVLGVSHLVPSSSTFAVRARTIGQAAYTTREIETKIGSIILRRRPDLRVDLSSPSTTVWIEVRGTNSYISVRRIRGLGGLPEGSQGQAFGLLDDPVLSVVAFLAMKKRGVHVVPVVFHHANWADSLGSVFDFLASRSVKQKPYAILVENSASTPVNAGLSEAVRSILERRARLRVVSALVSRHRALGIVTGENLNYVDLGALTFFDQACNVPVFRPILTMTPGEIEDFLKAVGFARRLDSVSIPSLSATDPDLTRVVSELEKDIDHESIWQSILKRSRRVQLLAA